MSVKDFLEKIFDIVLPATGDEVRVRKLKSLPVDPQYVTTRSGLKVYTLASLRHRDVQATIHTLKYHGNRKSIELCARLLGDALVEELAEMNFWGSSDPIIIPVPLSKKRLRKRGFNQIEKILSGMPGVRTDILVRTKDCKPQTSLSGSERMKNVEGVFQVVSPEIIKGQHVILVDDVVTTGATLTDVVRSLKDSGARDVLPVALARA